MRDAHDGVITGVEHDDLITFLTDRLPHFMVPRYVAVVDSLPKTPTEKVRKHLLRNDYAKYDVWDRQAAKDSAGGTAR